MQPTRYTTHEIHVCHAGRWDRWVYTLLDINDTVNEICFP